MVHSFHTPTHGNRADLAGPPAGSLSESALRNRILGRAIAAAIWLTLAGFVALLAEFLG